MSTLDQILAILMGRKVYDSATGLWRVYDSNGVELADPSGILLRGLHGWLLQQAAMLSAVRRECEVDFVGDRKRKSRQTETDRLAELVEAQAQATAKRDAVVSEKKAVTKQRRAVPYRSLVYFELRTYEALLDDEIARADALIAEYAAQQAAMAAIMDRLAWQQEQQRLMMEQAAMEADMAIVLAMITEAA